MIPEAYLTQWRATSAPWPTDEQVEQDLVISRALVEMFSVPALRQKLAFRGGTALYKLHLPPARYSEDIDLVQVQTEAIAETSDLIREALSWLGDEPQWATKSGRFNLYYRFPAESSGTRLKLKIEINTREHFAVDGWKFQDFSVESPWYTGEASIRTFGLEELLATKLRALYQRKKGRDLFDLWRAMEESDASAERVVELWSEYLERDGTSVSRAQFEMNLAKKNKSRGFRSDISPLLSDSSQWDFDTAFEAVSREFIARIPGDPWAGSNE